MATLMLLICVVLAGASFVSFTAAGYGESWASDICYMAPLACGNPQAMAYSAAAFGFLWLIVKFVVALRG